ncbi:hypothetical protein ACF3VQ_21710 (plasmid) [Yersinia sp. HM-2024]|uniref:hypothetical protein n=1 Tax=Yersinia sp. HM-2024 TaxID=3344550 RepID=UPI00370D99B1
MDTVEKILDCIGIKLSDINSLDQTDSLIIGRIISEVQHYAMYHDKKPELEAECEKFDALLKKHLKSL